MRSITCAAAVTAAILASTQAYAEEYRAVQQSAQPMAAQPVAGWSGAVGAGVLATPEYEGGEDYDLLPLPYFDVRYSDKLEINPFRGLRYHALRSGGWSFGVGAGADFGRDEDDADRLQGLGDVDPTLEGLLFTQYQHQRWDMGITLAQDVTGSGHEGYRVTGEVGYAMPMEGLFLRPSISTTYASDDYMQSYFSVTPGQSARSAAGLAPYDAKAGFKDVSLQLFAKYPVAESWSVNGLVQYKHLLSDAADSPIVEQEQQVSVGAFVAYDF